jgi:RNA recognition motif-containing protein
VKEDPDGRSRGYGFVNFEDPALVEQVMAQQDHVIDGRKVSLRPILQVASLERSCKRMFMIHRQVDAGLTSWIGRMEQQVHVMDGRITMGG